jgi:hypothetical protein
MTKTYLCYMGIRIWLDDERTPRFEGWVWVKTSASAIEFLSALQETGAEYEIISFDHDLGGDDTSRRVMNLIIENEFFPTSEVFVHSANPIGKSWLRGTAERYMPEYVKVAV